MIHDFHPEARLEYREAAIFYESRRPGLGATFTIEVERTIERIKEAPAAGQSLNMTCESALRTFFLTAFFTPLSKTEF